MLSTSQSFSISYISKQIRKRDFDYTLSSDENDIKRKELIEKNLKALSGRLNPTIVKKQTSEKPVYSIHGEEFLLIERRLNKILKDVYSLKSANREKIIRQLKVVLLDPAPYRIYRFDIFKFFESVNSADLIKQLKDDGKLNNYTLDILESFYSSFPDKGLLRGLSISSSLAEILLCSFDHSVRNTNAVVFFQRFVDDIIIITTGREESKGFGEQIEKYLPQKLQFKKKKSFESLIPKTSKFVTALPMNFLGYKFFFDVTPDKKKRDITVDISDEKIKKIKTRIILSIKDFCDSLNSVPVGYMTLPKLQIECSKLKRRLFLLSSNYTVYDTKSGIKRTAGFYYNFKLIDHKESEGLIDLDEFLSKALLCNRGKVFSRFQTLCSNYTHIKVFRRSLLKILFSKRFENRVFVSFDPRELKMLKNCWKYES